MGASDYNNFRTRPISATFFGSGIKLGQNCVYTLRQIDEDRVRKAEKAGEEETKQARKRARMVRKKLIDDDKAKEQDYEAGMF
ncbi:hypothetical protein J6590_007504 [Homalodisca vitripennis]|nr:hypothetical protein J6590_007504 [Homalodisca vitripennis]